MTGVFIPMASLTLASFLMISQFNIHLLPSLLPYFKGITLFLKISIFSSTSLQALFLNTQSCQFFEDPATLFVSYPC